MKDQHRARKRFGQNFLTDESVIHDIARSINPSSKDHLVEIGPGKGALTEALLEYDSQLDVIELDRDLVAMLQERFPKRNSFRIHSGDALSFQYDSLPQAGEKLRVVGNLPYNISTPLIFKLLNQGALIQDMHFMLQLEVVNRLSASPGSKAWGKLGVMAQYQCRVDKLFEVPPTAFSPAPKVQSAIVRLQPRPEQDWSAEQRSRLLRIVQAAFSQRRKTLRNTLRDLVSVQQLEELGISPSARAETLDLQQFLALGQLLDD
jgi:16S rRNA (adenine1518-N6/adenine1519-N6)-dimethyltransferase